MHQTYTILQKILLFLRLAAPITVTQFALLAGSFFAVFLTGQYSTTALAGMSIGYNIWIAIFMGINGVLMGIIPIIAQLLGADKKENIPTIIRQGLYVATFFGIAFIGLGALFLRPVLLFLGLEPAAYAVAVDYMTAIACGIFPLLWTCVLRNTVDAHGYTHISTMIIVSSFILNVILNYICIFGISGFVPALGGFGAGVASTISWWYNFIVYSLIIHYKKPFAQYHVFHRLGRPLWLFIREQLSIGIPIGIAMFAEVSIFSASTLLMAQYGTNIIAAHSAALSFTNLFYSLPVSISAAATIAVGYEVGAKRFKAARYYSHMSRILAIICAALICSYSFTHMEQISALFTNDPGMIDLIGSFLTYAVFFTVIDAFGTPLQGVLRGYKDVKIISYIAIASYWGTTVPLVYICSDRLGYGPYGVWIALLASVAVASICYTIRVWYIQHKRYPTEDII